MTDNAHYSYILFFTSNHAFRAEKLLKRDDIPCKLVPVPRQFSSECGVCLRIEQGVQTQAERLLTATQVDIDCIRAA